MKKIIFIIIVIALVISAGKFLKEQKQAVEDLEKPLVYTKSVSTTTAKQRQISKYREFLAQVQSKNSAYIASKFSTTIKKIYVEESQVVKQGQLLVSLDDSELRASLLSLKDKESALIVEVENANKTLQRNKKLLDIAAISKEMYDNSNVIYQNKLSSLKSIKQSKKQILSQLKYLNIKAPFDGIVGSKSADVGSLAISGKPILTINSKDQKLTFSFINTKYPIFKGQKVYIGDKVIGEISKIYDNAKNSLLIAEIKPYKILPFVNKSFKNIKVEVDSRKGCSVPMNAILHNKDKTYVMEYNNKNFKAKEVDILIQNSNFAILKSCPTSLVATASEAKLSILPSYGNINITKEDRAK